MAVRMIELVSPLSPAECEARLQVAVVPSGPFAWFRAGLVYGTVRNGWVEFRKRDWRNNVLRPRLSGRLEPCADGTVIRCRVGPDTFERVLLGLFVAGGAVVALVGVVGVLSALAAGGPVRFAHLGACVPLVIGLVSWLHSRYLVRGEDQFLITFAAEKIGAQWRELEPPPMWAALLPRRVSVQPRSHRERDDGQPDWVLSFPVLVVVSLVVVVLLVCAGVPVLVKLFG